MVPPLPALAIGEALKARAPADCIGDAAAAFGLVKRERRGLRRRKRGDGREAAIFAVVGDMAMWWWSGVVEFTLRTINGDVEVEIGWLELCCAALSCDAVHILTCGRMCTLVVR